MTIINQTPIGELNILWLIVPAAILILTVGILCVLSINTPKKLSRTRVQTSYVLICTFGIILFLIWYGIASAFLQTPTDNYTYEATFDNIETLNEWFENKTFVEYNDGVYIFKDKAG